MQEEIKKKCKELVELVVEDRYGDKEKVTCVIPYPTIERTSCSCGKTYCKMEICFNVEKK